MSSNQPLSVFKSDSLYHLRPFFDSLDELKVFDPIHQFPIIVDSCVVIADLIFLTKNREKSDARTDLQESRDAGTIVLFAPEELRDEVEARIASFSKENNISLELLKNEWVKYSQSIQFEKVEMPDNEIIKAARDPKDLPFLQLQQQTGYPIYTRDEDIEEMGGKVVKKELFRSARNYSREAAVGNGFLASVFITIGVISFLLQSIWDGLKQIFILLKKSPGWFQIGCLCIVIVLFLNKPVRNKTTDYSRKTLKKSKNVTAAILNFMIPLIKKYHKAKTDAERYIETVKKQYYKSI